MKVKYGNIRNIYGRDKANMFEYLNMGYENIKHHHVEYNTEFDFNNIGIGEEVIITCIRSYGNEYHGFTNRYKRIN